LSPTTGFFGFQRIIEVQRDKKKKCHADPEINSELALNLFQG
jgi:hypothetical protein